MWPASSRGGPRAGSRSARGSRLVPVLLHFQINLPVWHASASWGMVLFAVVAMIVVNRGAMLLREGAITQILMPDDEPAADARA